MPAIPEAQREELGGDANADDSESVDGSEGDDWIDSGRNVLSNGEDYNMSDIEEDKNYLEEAKRGIEYESGSNCSVESDIP